MPTTTVKIDTFTESISYDKHVGTERAVENRKNDIGLAGIECLGDVHVTIKRPRTHNSQSLIELPRETRRLVI